MSDKRIDDHITKSYQRWLDYSRFHATHASIPDQAEDVLNEVLLSLLEKDQQMLLGMLQRKRKGFTELDFYVLKMIKLNCHSKTSPYRQKMKDVPADTNIPAESLDEEFDPEEDYDTPGTMRHNQVMDNPPEQGDDPIQTMLKRYQKIREMLDTLDITETEKKIFYWKFFKGNHLLHWPGQEKYTAVRESYMKVKKLLVNKIRNPYSTRKPWNAPEISYLKNEYPNTETIKISTYLKRNYTSVHNMARKLGLKKSKWYLSMIRRRTGKKTSS
jgi:hypothetical protein